MLCWLLAACSTGSPTPAPPVDPVHHAYVWQRRWTTEVRRAVRDQRPVFDALRVHALSVDEAGMHRWTVPTEALGVAIPVARVETTARDGWAALVATELTQVVAAWRRAGVSVLAVELDHDCPTSQLPAYARQLASVRRVLPRDVQLWHTALPTWTGSPTELAHLRAQADGSVLQVHAVDRPERGLFDAPRALAWAGTYAEISDSPFLVSVPAYGVAVGADGAVEAEAAPVLGAARELWAEPGEVVGLVAALRQAAPRGWQGTAWFRLPTAQDRRAWAWPTLRDAVAGRAVPTAVRYGAVPAAAGVFDIYAEVSGGVPRPLDPAVDVTGDCSVVEGLGGLTARRLGDRWRLEGHRGLATPGRPVAWARCATLPEVRAP